MSLSALAFSGDLFCATFSGGPQPVRKSAGTMNRMAAYFMAESSKGEEG
jgi:hypothetical protein